MLFVILIEGFVRLCNYMNNPESVSCVFGSIRDIVKLIYHEDNNKSEMPDPNIIFEIFIPPIQKIISTNDKEYDFY